MIIPDWVAYTFLAGAFIATIGVLLMGNDYRRNESARMD